MTAKEAIILAFLIVAGITLVVSLICKGVRVMFVLAIAFLLFSVGFFWIPDRLHEAVYGKEQTQETLQDAMKESDEYIRTHYQSWLDAGKNVVRRITAE